MKFNHSLQFNAVPEWTGKYIAYSNLKKLIYSLEKSSKGGNDGNEQVADEESALLTDTSRKPEEIFKLALDDELAKINEFYIEQEAQVFQEFDELILEEDEFQTSVLDDTDMDDIYERRRSSADDKMRVSRPKLKDPFAATTSESRHQFDQEVFGQHDENAENYPVDIAKSTGSLISADSGSEDFDDTEEAVNRRKTTRSRSQGDNRYSARNRSGSRTLPWGFLENQFLNEKRINLKKKATQIYVSLCELRSYQQLNKTGFTKALKKFDKTIGTKLRTWYLENCVDKTYIFIPTTEELLDEKVDKAIALYARVATSNDNKQARAELRLHLREHVVWERNTVWRDMIGLERKAHGLTTIAGGDKKIQLQGDQPTILRNGKTHWTIMGIDIPRWLHGTRAVKLYIILPIFFALLRLETLEDTAQANCLAVLVLASYLWATEAIPLFITSLLVPFLVVLLRITKYQSGDRMMAPDVANFIFGQMWNNVIMLLLGGFTLAAALSKFHIAKIMATAILSKAGTNPNAVLGMMMFVSWFLSMWISNVASPVLMFSILQPLLRTLPTGSSFAKSLILGIALSANIGGMASPIASPQNLIAIEVMDPAPTWAEWFSISIPVCFFSLVVTWAYLIVMFRPGNTVIQPIRVVKESFVFKQYFIIVVSVCTIILWCLNQQLQDILGGTGVIALIPIVLFFGTGLLTSEDFNNFLWTIVALAMGGIALGKAVSSSGLLVTIARVIESKIDGFSTFGVLIIFGALVLVCATFVSHTVAALVILPLVNSIGMSLPDGHPRILVMASALLCSAAMGLPTSGFPNVTAICMTDEVGRPYVTVIDFIKSGVPSSILCYGIIMSVGYWVMTTINY
ncbi:SPX-domain-containing protein [Nadsonia fulvescens var. elongata DSM 6958]|uniref:SPX-domain-containing protein n=1 Tax=Nadsonia fulvescens var. elongata DSM 6958 TaxID=857566 RepID=A0A1E3PIT7_9ASCO|nr:SPX-domain-containing protein [Nadsonia fulvescens var. elongata DSM 6958]